MRVQLNILHRQKLWGLTKRRKFKWWEIHVRHNADDRSIIEIVTNHAAAENAKVVETIERITEGRSIGRSNETTPAEQAVLQAKSKMRKQLDKGYVVSKDMIIPELGLLNVLKHPRPMLAEPVKKLQDKDIQGQLFTQPKLDGHRCTVTFDPDDTEADQCGIVMYSRAGKRIITLPHIAEQIADIGLREGEYLDGELYLHGEGTLQDLGSLIRRKQERSTTIQYWIYDSFQLRETASFGQRRSLVQEFTHEHLVQVPTHAVDSVEEAMAFFSQWRKEGYEGAMLRLDGYDYEAGFRSRSLLKIKSFFDSEFEVVDVLEGKPRIGAGQNGEDLSVAILSVIDPEDENVSFTITAPGNMYEKDEIWQNKEDYIGRQVTVKYSMRTKDNIPFHPVAMQFREDI